MILTISIVVAATIIGLLLVALVAIYNKLATRRIRARNAFSQIEVQLQRRHDLIPNLVETARAYMDHERQTLEEVTRARTEAIAATDKASGDPGDPASVQSLARAESALVDAIGRLMAVVEAYPDLKANQNMLMLQEELASAENRVAFARQAYNDSVTTYNITREVFPQNLVAGAFGFKQLELFQLDDPAARSVPDLGELYRSREPGE